MENVTQFILSQFLENGTFATITSGSSISIHVNIRIIQSTIASVGIVANLTVILVFLNHKKLRRKIPNIFIINQVSVVEVDTFAHWELQKYLNNTVLLIMIKIGVQQSWNITKEIFPVHFVGVMSTFCGTSFDNCSGFPR